MSRAGGQNTTVRYSYLKRLVLAGHRKNVLRLGQGGRVPPTGTRTKFVLVVERVSDEKLAEEFFKIKS